MRETAPLLKGFCGDFIRGVDQLAGSTFQSLSPSPSPLRTSSAKTGESESPSQNLLRNHLNLYSSFGAVVRRNPNSPLPKMSFAAGAPVASTSNLKEPTATGSVTQSSPAQDTSSTSERLLDQREVLDRLAEGEGVSAQDWAGVVEYCYICNNFMLEAFFKGHYRDCWGVYDESEPDAWGK
jgi:hypothetical protein